MTTLRLLLASVLVAGAHARGRVLMEGEEFKGGQPDSAAYTAGGTSKPCTGLYCQDNPLGNPCPCPVVKPCRHENDGHCMNRVNIMGRYSPCSYHIPGVWSAEMAGMINLGQKKAGGCMLHVDSLARKAGGP